MTTAKGGRPLTELNDDKLEAMCKIFATGEECAGVLGIDYDTLNRRLKEEGHGGFTDWYKKHSSHGKVSLRRAQMKLALEGNATMLIWEGKQFLGQSDKIEEKSTQVHLQTEFDFSTLDDEQRGMMRNLLKSNDKDGA
jgi:hypothetical protein